MSATENTATAILLSALLPAGTDPDGKVATYLDSENAVTRYINAKPLSDRENAVKAILVMGVEGFVNLMGPAITAFEAAKTEKEAKPADTIFEAVAAHGYREMRAFYAANRESLESAARKASGMVDYAAAPTFEGFLANLGTSLKSAQIKGESVVYNVDIDGGVKGERIDVGMEPAVSIRLDGRSVRVASAWAAAYKARHGRDWPGLEAWKAARKAEKAANKASKAAAESADASKAAPTA